MNVFKLLLPLPLFAACNTEYSPPVQPHHDPWILQRERMVTGQIEGRGVFDERVLNAMRAVPRHEFVPLTVRESSYADHPLPIGFDQTISQPYIVAAMTEALELKPDDTVLEIGTGSGYQAAVLSLLVSNVYSIEIIEPLGKRAMQDLARLGYTNVTVKCGDGYEGWPEHAPFDAIIVTCAPDEIPKPLLDQLAEGGRIVIPVGNGMGQQLIRVTKRSGELQREDMMGVIFVPMTGKARQE